MVIYIEEFVKTMHSTASIFTKSALPQLQVASERDGDDDPNDDPPAARLLAA
jgi:hypothetical protein